MLFRSSDLPRRTSSTLPQRKRLRRSRDFQHVYAHGQRCDTLSMAVFVCRNELAEHRLGVTASSKAIGGAVQRNRAKRLLREVFRLSGEKLERLDRKYDWVFNARPPLMQTSLLQRLREFGTIIDRLAQRREEVSLRSKV